MFTPQILGRVGGGPLRNAGSLKQLDSTPTSGLSCCIGSFLVGADSALKVMGSAAATASYVVVGLLESDGVTPVKKGHVTFDEMDAGWAGFVRVMPIGELVFVGEEDGVGGNIADTDAAKYADLIVAEPSAAEKAVFDKVLGPEQIQPNIKIDSNTVNASASGLLIQLMGLHETPDQPKNNTTRVRRFKFQIISTNATYTQSAHGA